MASLTSSGEYNEDVDFGDSDDPYKLREAKSIALETADIHEDTSKVGNLTWSLTPYIIISVDTSNTHYGNLTESGASISTSGPHGRRCSE